MISEILKGPVVVMITLLYSTVCIRKPVNPAAYRISAHGCHMVITCLFFATRLHPAIRWERRLTKDVVLSGYKVPSGVSVSANGA